MPYALAIPGPFGIWCETEKFDVIVYQEGTTKAHQDHIIRHEVGHVIAGHKGDSTVDEEDTILPDILERPEYRRLRRTCYDTANERDAELIASILGEAMGIARRIAMPVDPALADETARLDSSLSVYPGWWR